MNTHATATPPARMSELGARALLGTDRAGGSPATADALLREAAVLGAKARAGKRPALTRSAMPECPSDPMPAVNSACAAMLRRMLTDGDGGLIEEWAELAAACNRRVSDALAPGLVEWWTKQPRPSQAVRQAMGVRAEWLSALNPEWRKEAGVGALPADVDGAWQTGSAADRIGLLMTVREMAPSVSERLLRGTWAQDAADDRRKFVEKCEVGLSMADEPFLEWALDDRSKQVREAASTLLARLGASRFAARMLERAASLFSVEYVKKGLLRKAAEKITLEPPAAWESAWERDGMEEKPRVNMGKRAWWLQQILQRTTPAALAARMDISAERLLEVVAKSEYADAGLAALGSAAARGGDSWCVLLVRYHMTDKKTVPEQIEPLWSALAPAAREPLLLDVVHKGHFDWAQRLAIFGAADHRWSAGFTTTVFALLAKDKPSKEQDVWFVHPHLEKMARWMHPAGLAALEMFVAAVFKDAPPPSAIKSIDRARLRAEMHKEFQS